MNSLFETTAVRRKSSRHRLRPVGGGPAGRLLGAMTAASLLLCAPAAAHVGAARIGAAHGASAPGQAKTFKVSSTVSEKVDRMSVYLDAGNRARTVQLGLYANTSPHRLMGRCTVRRPHAGGWNSCAFKPVRVHKGTAYWTALLPPRRRHGGARTRRLAFRYVAGAATAHTSWRTHRAELPRRWSGRTHGGARSASLYAYSAGSEATADGAPAAGSVLPSAAFTIAPSPVVAGQSTSFDGSSSTCDRSPCAYSWTDPDDGQHYATGIRFSYTFASTGTHRVTLTVTDARGRAASTTKSFDVQAGTAPAPTPSPTPNPTSTTDNCMRDPSACGFPDLDGPDQVGVQPGVALQPVSGTVTLSTPGQVYENKQVTGMIRVTASNVTIRNVKLIATDGYYGILSQGRSLVVDHVEVDHQGQLGAPGGGDFYAIGTQNYSASHMFIHDGSDCAGMSGVNVAINVSITDSLCAVGIDANGDGWPDGGEQHVSNGPLPPNPATPSYCYAGGGQHFDGFQSDGGYGITLRHNVVRNPCSQTSAILMSSNTAPIENVTIADNLLAGGGFSLYCAGSPDQSSTTNDNVTGNRVARTYWTEGGYYAPDAYCGAGWTDTWSGNVWDEDGSPLPRNG